MSYSELQAKELLIEGIKAVADQPDLGPQWLDQFLAAYVEGYRPAEFLYQPSKELINRIDQYKQWCEDQKGENPGKLMEEIAFLAFQCIRGNKNIKSYQSYAPQHDLVVSGSDIEWHVFLKFLHIPEVSRTIIVEAKNLTAKVDDKQFSRLCGILETKFHDTSNLGVFFTRKGATGFPLKSRKRELRDAQATQVIYHAKTGKYIIVLDSNDILRLIEPGSLPRILEAKIRGVEEWTGLPIDFDEVWTEIDLPEHLLKYAPK